MLAVIMESELAQSDAHKYLTLKVANDQVMPCILDFELDIYFLCWDVPQAGFLVTKDSIELKLCC